MQNHSTNSMRSGFRTILAQTKKSLIHPKTSPYHWKLKVHFNFLVWNQFNYFMKLFYLKFIAETPSCFSHLWELNCEICNLFPHQKNWAKFTMICFESMWNWYNYNKPRWQQSRVLVTLTKHTSIKSLFAPS